MEGPAILALIAIYSMGVVSGLFIAVGAHKLAMNSIGPIQGGVKADDLAAIQKGLDKVLPQLESFVNVLKQGAKQNG